MGLFRPGRFAVLLLGLSLSTLADPLIVTGVTPTDGNALTLAQQLAGAGIAVDSATFIGNANTTAFQQGTFTGGAGILPFDSGVLLTSGNALSAPGPNTSPSASTDWQAPGDIQLTTLAGHNTYDANILTFTFHKSDPTAPDVLSFQYVFASEEYNEWVNSQFNDVFAFYLNGTNIALVPGTSTPVSINSVNCSVNAGFYQSNDPFDSAQGGCTGAHTNLNTQYDGIAGGLFAQPLFASGPLIVGENTIQLAIADAGDHVLDAGVFLKAGSFVPQPPPSVPEPSALWIALATFGGLIGGRRKLA